MAVERFDALGLWRQPRAEVIMIAVSLFFFIARSKFIPPYPPGCTNHAGRKSSADRRTFIVVPFSPAYKHQTATYSPEYCAPIANAVVHLLRQFLSTSSLPPDHLAGFVLKVEPLVLMIDARSAAETGTRPLFSRDDLEDNPVLDGWLSQHFPAPDGVDGLDALTAGMIRLLREFASGFHRRESLLGMGFGALDAHLPFEHLPPFPSQLLLQNDRYLT